MEGQKLLLFELQSNFCQPFVQIFGVGLRKATRLFLGYLRDISRVSCRGMLSSLLLIRLTWCWCNGSRDRVFAPHSRHYCSSNANDYFWRNIRDSNVMWYGRGYIVRFGARGDIVQVVQKLLDFRLSVVASASCARARPVSVPRPRLGSSFRFNHRTPKS